MSGLNLPALAAAGAVAVLAVGGMSALPQQAAADEGDGGAGSAVSAGTTATGDAAVGATAGASAGATDAPTGTATDGATAVTSADTPAGASPGASSTAPAESMNVSPQTVAPGGVVTLHLQTSCSVGHKAEASAEVFVSAVTLAPAGNGDGLEGSAFIKSDAADGSYAISVDCDGVASSAQASVTVVTGGATPSASPTAPAAAPQQPVNPVPAGGGGTARLAAGPAAAGTSAGPLLATGGFAAVGLTGLVVHRRRASDRG